MENLMSNVDSCRLCGARSPKVLFAVDFVDIIECTSCGFRFPAKLPSPDELSRHYDNAYSGTRFIKGQRVNAETNLNILRRLLPSLNGLRILDVGSGYGFLAKALNDISGTTCHGLEISQDLRIYAQENLGISVFSDFSEITEIYDLVISFEVLEHIADPLSFMKAIVALLSDSGKVILGTDNFKSSSVLSMGPRFPKWIPQEHISCFTPMSIRLMLNNVPGIAIKSISTYVTWEMRLASIALIISNTVRVLVRRYPVSSINYSVSKDITSPPSCLPDHRKYKLFRLRLLLNPIVALATLSCRQDNEMFVVEATRVQSVGS